MLTSHTCLNLDSLRNQLVGWSCATGCNYEVTCYCSDEVKIVTSENIWRYATKHVDALNDGRKNFQRAIKLCMKDSDGLPIDLSNSILSLQSDLLTLREGIWR